MKKLFLRVVSLAFLATLSANVFAEPIMKPDTLGFAFNGPGNNGGGFGHPHSPVYPPFVVKEGHTLYLYSGCDGAELALIDEDSEEVYSEDILEGTPFIVLPEWLEGTYELQIRLGSYVFYTEIEL